MSYSKSGTRRQLLLLVCNSLLDRLRPAYFTANILPKVCDVTLRYDFSAAQVFDDLGPDPDVSVDFSEDVRPDLTTVRSTKDRGGRLLSDDQPQATGGISGATSLR